MTPLEERFPGRRAFVTGAGGGLGRALCLALARRGFWIGVQDNNSEAAQATAKAVNDVGARGWAFLFDVGVADDFADAALAFNRDIGPCDLLFNNAGVAVAGTVDEVPLEDWEWIIATNLWGPINGVRAFLPSMLERRSGHIVNTASLAGLVTAPRMGAYSVTKYGVVALSETLRTDLRSTGVSVSVVCPSFFPTGIARAGRGDERVKAVAQYLMDKGWSPDRVAEAVIRGIERDRLYILPQPDARILWMIKRLSPRLAAWASVRLNDWAFDKAGVAR